MLCSASLPSSASNEPEFSSCSSFDDESSEPLKPEDPLSLSLEPDDEPVFVRKMYYVNMFIFRLFQINQITILYWNSFLFLN